MSFSQGYGKDYGELFDYDEASVIIGDTGGPSSSPSRATTNPISQATTDRFSSIRCSSEMSMDLSDLQDLLDEEDYTSRLAPGSMYSNNALSDDSTSPWHQHQNQLNDLVSGEEDVDRKCDDDDGGGYNNSDYRSNAHGVNDTITQFDEIPEHYFQQNDRSDFSSCHAMSSPFAEEDQHQPLSTVDEQGETESESSMSMSSLVASQESSSRNLFHSSNGSTNSRRKVKFERSTRLEDIQEFEKPDIEDYHMLYYTAHELQKMIDGQRAEERRDRHVVR